MEKTIFSEALGNSPAARILDFLITGRGLDYSLTDIAQNSGVGWTSLHRIWDKLVKLNLVMHTRDIGKAKLFRINSENPAVRRLIKFYDELIKQESEKVLKEKIKVEN